MDYKYFKLRIEDIKETGEFSGYGSVFGNKDAYSDIVDQGAFKRTINNHKGIIPMMFNHDPDKEVALSSSMEENEMGLLIAGKLYISDDPKMDLRDARDTYIKMKNRAAANKPMGMSIGYDIITESFDKENNVRHLKEIKLWEISFVTFPANELATVDGVKSFCDYELNQIINFCKSIDKKEGRVLSTSNRNIVKNALEALQALLDASESDDSKNIDSEFLVKCQELAKEFNEKLFMNDLKNTTMRLGG